MESPFITKYQGMQMKKMTRKKTEQKLCMETKFGSRRTKKLVKFKQQKLNF
jgi:hypothetical protein